MIRKIAAGVILAALAVTGLTACDAGSESNNGTTGIMNNSSEAKDVLSVSTKKDPYIGTKLFVKVKNSSPKTSDYMIEVSAESANGKTQYDTTTVFIQNVKPGQTAIGNDLFMKKIPSTAKFVVGSVDRSESL